MECKLFFSLFLILICIFYYYEYNNNITFDKKLATLKDNIEHLDNVDVIKMWNEYSMNINIYMTDHFKLINSKVTHGKKFNAIKEQYNLLFERHKIITSDDLLGYYDIITLNDNMEEDKNNFLRFYDNILSDFENLAIKREMLFKLLKACKMSKFIENIIELDKISKISKLEKIIEDIKDIKHLYLYQYEKYVNYNIYAEKNSIVPFPEIRYKRFNNKFINKLYIKYTSFNINNKY